jgi:outer membrane receptor protein involved in Fe transport
MHLRLAVRTILGVSTLAVAYATAAQDEPEQTVGIEEIIVTAQKREESIQSVPIAVTALTADALTTQRINLAQDLSRAVPNLYYSRAGVGYNETNFQLRGIGYQLVSTAGDAGVGVHVNNAPLGVNRMGQSELFDMERVEVLRGPQGTLYGRNATGGVINMITAKPELGAFSGEGSLEFADYDHKRIGGHMNMPLGDLAALRLAGFGLHRAGYTKNVLTGGNVDGREMYSGRATLAINPEGSFRTTLMWQHSFEDDDRIGNSRTMCIKDAGPTSVGGVAIASAQARQFLNVGCLPGSIYSPAANGSVNYGATLAGQLGSLAGLLSTDAYAGVMQTDDLREIALTDTPTYESTNDLYTLNIELDVTDGLMVTALSSFLEDDVNTNVVGAGYVATATFNPGPVTPGGFYNDPQLGRSNSPDVRNITDQHAEQWSQELRLQSKFDGPVNFNVGALYMNLERLNDLLIVPNMQNAYAQLACPTCYFDASPTPDGTGHNYYISRNPYELNASAVFGELYWNVVDNFTVTTGVRYTEDKKEFQYLPVTMLTPGRGWAEDTITNQEAEWKETTGRVNGAWRPTAHNLLYVSYSKGYKGGGINAPDVTTNDRSPTYEPEFVNAYEIGSKNEFFDARVQVNVTAFFYDYQGYQISARRGLTSLTENVDAEIKGVELEGVWQPIEALRLNANVGLLDTRLTNGTSVDVMNRTQGNTAFTTVKSTADACVVPTAALANFVSLMNNGTVIPAMNRALRASDLLGVCAGSFAAFGLTPTGGVEVDLKDKQLPQAPDLNVSVGGQYEWQFANGWTTLLRADYFYQADAYSRIYNSESDLIKGWDNANASLTIANKSLGWDVQIYGKNLMDDDVITGIDQASDALGLVRNVSVLDPRLIGLTVTKRF